MPAAELTDELTSLAHTVPGVHGVDKLFARKTGLQYHVDLHIEVEAALSVGESHAIAGHVRSRLKRDAPWAADVLVHVEPAGESEPAAPRGRE